MKRATNPTRRSWPTPSIVLACAALFLALGGSAVAANRLIHARDIAPGAVTSRAIRNGAVSPADLSARTRALLDDQGLTGARGETGANGAPGSNGANGANGPNGANGANGVDGSNGTMGKTERTASTGPTGRTERMAPTARSRRCRPSRA